ncbi:MAG: NAD+ synthase [Candidatus Bathyarchaeota archaeon]|nr:NAD+ synthase [Candidatus Bathyarchaeota archaeon]
MAQINCTVGDLEGNIKKIVQTTQTAKSLGVDCVCFPELAVTGYPPQDLLHESDFVEQNKQRLLEAISELQGIGGVIGFVDCEGKKLYNAAAVFADGKIVRIIHKTLLPTYDVFDEDRYFKAASENQIQPVEISINGKRLCLGVEICEDLWDDQYTIKVTDLLVQRGAQAILNISSSPFYVGKRFERQKLICNKIRKHKVPLLYVNLVGGQDELVFDGQSMAFGASGQLLAVGRQFQEDLVVVELDSAQAAAPVEFEPYSREAEMFNALALGIRDYFKKSGFTHAVVGMSGGIDSSLSSCIAVEALGKENVIGVSMPSKYSSSHSKTDAEKLAQNLDILYLQLGIQDIVDSYRKALSMPLRQIRKHYGISPENDDPVADENLQPRTRGNCLMDIANRLKALGILVVNTGNKTELALGYCTLYGDMAGGIGALGDVSKLDVYRLARYVNAKWGGEVIPEAVFVKAPSPELKECQFDPFDFEVVSPLVDEFIENRRSRAELVAMGYGGAVVEDTYRRIRNSEYKRRQAVPCIKITSKAFGLGRKMPIVNKF